MCSVRGRHANMPDPYKSGVLPTIGPQQSPRSMRASTLVVLLALAMGCRADESAETTTVDGSGASAETVTDAPPDSLDPDTDSLFEEIQAEIDAQLRDAFRDYHQYARRYRKTGFQDKAHLRSRFDHFRSSLERIQRRQNGTAQYGLTKFSDLSAEEFLRQHTGLQFDESVAGGRTGSTAFPIVGAEAA